MESLLLFWRPFPTGLSTVLPLPYLMLFDLKSGLRMGLKYRWSVIHSMRLLILINPIALLLFTVSFKHSRVRNLIIKSIPLNKNSTFIAAHYCNHTFYFEIRLILSITGLKFIYL